MGIFTIVKPVGDCQFGAFLSSKRGNLIRTKVVSDAASSKAVVLVLINCLIHCLFLLCLFVWSLLFCCKALVYLSC